MPVSVPAGTVMFTVFRVRTSPEPLHVGHGLRRHLSAAQAHRTRTVHGESALPERDHAAAVALGTLAPLRAGRAAAARGTWRTPRSPRARPAPCRPAPPCGTARARPTSTLSPLLGPARRAVRRAAPCRRRTSSRRGRRVRRGRRCRSPPCADPGPPPGRSARGVARRARRAAGARRRSRRTRRGGASRRTAFACRGRPGRCSPPRSP